MHIYSCTPLMHHFHVPSSFLFLELFFPRNLRWVSACSVSSSGSHHCWSRGGNKEWFVQTPEHSFKHTFARVYRWSSSPEGCSFDSTLFHAEWCACGRMTFQK